MMPPFLPGGELVDPPPRTQTWPGVTYPWMPWAPWAGPGAVSPLPKDGKLCLGTQCWWIAHITAADADEIVRVLKTRAPPLARASIAAVVLYERGFRQHARGVLRIYGGMYGMERVEEQIRRVYWGRTEVM